jgi:hypothetical protein
MTFEEAEARFRQLQARVQRGEAISRADYEDQVSQLAVQDPNGVLWEINPRTGKWMYFDGAEWVSGAPPGHDSSLVIPMVGGTTPPAAPTFQPSTPPSTVPKAPASRPPSTPESVQPYKRTPPGKAAGAGKPPSGASPQRPSQSSNIFAGREWVPLAIGAVVLLLCAGLLFFGGRFVIDMISPARTPTLIARPSPISSPLPTQVRLPSPTPIPPTPVPVIGQISEAQVNVRAQPNTRATILTRLARNTQITLVAVGPTDAGNVWYQINLPDRAEPAWVRGDTFQIISGDPKTLPPFGGTATSAAPKPGVTPTLTPIGVVPATPKP